MKKKALFKADFVVFWEHKEVANPTDWAQNLEHSDQTFPTYPLMRHCDSQNCPLQGFLGACMGSCGSTMARNGRKPLI